MHELALLHVAQAAPSCGPSFPPEGEMGRALLLALPIFLLTIPLFRRLTATWRGRWARDPRRGATLVRCAFWASVVSAMANLPGASAKTFGLVVIAVWIAGASWVALSLVGWRALVHWRPDLAGFVPPLLVSALFAGLAWGARAHSFGDEAFFLMVLPGLAGLVPAGLLVGFVVEAKLRGWWRTRNLAMV